LKGLQSQIIGEKSKIATNAEIDSLAEDINISKGESQIPATPLNVTDLNSQKTAGGLL